jgi:SNF2 family DNA or RNA helicase
MPQSGRDLYSQLNVLWPGGELSGVRDDFALRVDNDFAGIVRDVQPFVTRTPKSALGLPDYEVHRHEVPISGTQAEIYELIEGRFRRLVEDAVQWDDKLAALKRGRPIRLLQAACNPMLFNRDDGYYGVPRLQSDQRTLMERLAHYGEEELPAKSIAALALVGEITSRGEKVVCWSNFLTNLDHFAHLIRERTGALCFQVDGRVPAGDDTPDDRFDAPRSNASDEDTRERIIEEFLNAPKGAVLVTNPASCSESISLHRTCHHAIYLDRTYDSALFLQSIDRIHRLGLPQGVIVHVHLLLATCRGRSTIDHLADGSLRRKDARMRELLEGAEWLPIATSDNPLDAAEGTQEDLEELLRFLLGESG